MRVDNVLTSHSIATSLLVVLVEALELAEVDLAREARPVSLASFPAATRLPLAAANATGAAGIAGIAK